MRNRRTLTRTLAATFIALACCGYPALPQLPSDDAATTDSSGDAAPADSSLDASGADAAIDAAIDAPIDASLIDAAIDAP